MNPSPEGCVVLALSDLGERRRVRQVLIDAGIDVQEAVDGPALVQLARAERPALIIIDTRSMSDVQSALEQLRDDFRTAFTPTLFVSSTSPADGPLADLVGGGDDFLRSTDDTVELLERVRLNLHRSSALRGMNPLSGLPGNAVIAEEIESRLAADRTFALLYVDLDNFKAFNDRYGFTQGDAVIRTLGGCIVGALTELAGEGAFAGHVGGDDFVLLTDVPSAEPVARAITERFDVAVREHYDAAARDRGWVEIKDRRGQTVTAPLCSVSIGVAFSNPEYTSAAEMAQVATEVKGVAKREEGSSWAVDRRGR